MLASVELDDGELEAHEASKQKVAKGIHGVRT